MTLEIVRGHPKPPINGWHFHCHGQVFQGKDADALIARVVDYRTQNSLPLGNPEIEIADYLASVSPWLVRENGKPVQGKGPRQLVAENAMSIQYAKYERLPVHNPIVIERMEVCATCPFLGHEFHDAETSYWHDAEMKAALMTGDMDCAKKGHCKHHHWLIALACRLVTPEKVASMPSPEPCWLQST